MDYYSDETTNKQLQAMAVNGDPRAWETLKMRAARGGRKASAIVEKLAGVLGGSATPKGAQPSNRKPTPKSSVSANSILPPLYEWQQEALAVWRQRGRRGIIEAVTGAGKTVLGLAAARDELAQGGKVAVVVPTIILQKQWAEKLQLAFPHQRIGLMGGQSEGTLHNFDILVAVVNSAREKFMNPGQQRGLLIADECHRYGAETNALALESSFDARLGLSATYERMDDGHITQLVPYFGERCFTLDYKRAIRDGVICDFTVTFIGVDLTDEEHEEYEEQSERASKAKWRLANRFGIAEEPFGDFMQKVQQMSQGGHGEATGLARRYLDAFSKKRQVLAETKQKLLAVALIKEELRNSNRSIIFTETIRAANEISDMLKKQGVAAMAIHSKQKLTERDQILSKFRDGAIKIIVAPKVLDEGVDVPDVDIGVVVAAASTRRQMIQRMGRVLRKSQSKEYAKFAILYAKGTSEDPHLGAHEAFISDITEVASGTFYEDAGALLGG